MELIDLTLIITFKKKTNYENTSVYVCVHPCFAKTEQDVDVAKQK